MNETPYHPILFNPPMENLMSIKSPSLLGPVIVFCIVLGSVLSYYDWAHCVTSGLHRRERRRKPWTVLEVGTSSGCCCTAVHNAEEAQSHPSIRGGTNRKRHSIKLYKLSISPNTKDGALLTVEFNFCGVSQLCSGGWWNKILCHPCFIREYRFSILSLFGTKFPSSSVNGNR